MLPSEIKQIKELGIDKSRVEFIHRDQGHFQLLVKFNNGYQASIIQHPKTFII